ncbi:hypothetical protein CR155_16965 [Pollutimonas nitritireducens]|uniref:Porin domain-containing protein n=2 Tax=Pollutimonas nitritireducens TaxID=2045209 RepID=A0A2N4UCM3_9BURK|nr:hypothetical protein CR155_16965 [Pollutimonas nitritireducens]
MNGTQAQGGRLYGREAVLGLKSDAWGTITLGRQGNIAYRWLAGVATPFGNNFNQARSAGTFNVAEVRYDNQIQYLTPNISGFQAGVGYSFNADGEQEFQQRDQNEPNVHAVTAGLRYSNGSVAAVLTYDQMKDAETATGIKAKSWNLAGSYDFEVAEVHLGETCCSSRSPRINAPEESSIINCAHLSEPLRRSSLLFDLGNKKVMRVFGN